MTAPLDLDAMAARSQAAAALADAATAGPWEFDQEDLYDPTDDPPPGYNPNRLAEVYRENDRAFIAASRTAVPELAADNAALIAAVRRLREVLRDCPHHNRATTFNALFEKWYWDEVAPLLGDK